VEAVCSIDLIHSPYECVSWTEESTRGQPPKLLGWLTSLSGGEGLQRREPVTPRLQAVRGRAAAPITTYVLLPEGLSTVPTPRGLVRVNSRTPPYTRNCGQ